MNKHLPSTGKSKAHNKGSSGLTSPKAQMKKSPRPTKELNA